MKNRKGMAITGLLFMLATIVGAVSTTGVLFGGGNPAGSAVFVGSSALVAYSQMPHVTQEFQVKKAIALCEDGYKDLDVSDCSAEIGEWNGEKVLSYIKDDIVTPQYQMAERLGG